MKKFLLSLSLVLLCICLVGCSNAQGELADKLDAHLGRLSSTISSVKDINNSDITFQATTNDKSSGTKMSNPVVRENVNYDDQIALLTSDNQQSSIYEDVLETNNCLYSCKSQICEMIDMLKTLSNKIKKNEIKLADNQISGVNELLSNLSVNTNRISMSKNETNTEVGKVKSMLKNASENSAALNSRFIRLNNCLETRLTYYKNCLNCLNQIRVLLTCEDGNCTYENGEVCIDGKCYENTELGKYGDSKTNEEHTTLNESDQKLFEEFKAYLERTRQQNSAQNQEIESVEEKLRNSNENVDRTQIQNTTQIEEVKSEIVNEENRDIKNDDNNDKIDPSFTKDIKDDSFYANQRKDRPQMPRPRDNKRFENRPVEDKKEVVTRDINTTTENDSENVKNENVEKPAKRRGAVDTFGEPTVKKNTDTFRRANAKNISPTQMIFEFLTAKPFPEKITETNIVIFSEIEPDKQFVESTNVENSNIETIAK